MTSEPLRHPEDAQERRRDRLGIEAFLGFDSMCQDRIPASKPSPRRLRRGSRVGLGLGKVSGTHEHLGHSHADPRFRPRAQPFIVTVAPPTPSSDAVSGLAAPQHLWAHLGPRAEGLGPRGRAARRETSRRRPTDASKCGQKCPRELVNQSR